MVTKCGSATIIEDSHDCPNFSGEAGVHLELFALADVVCPAACGLLRGLGDLAECA
jgi:hypothetical protein